MIRQNQREVLVFTRRPDGGLEGQEIGADEDRTFDKFGEVGDFQECPNLVSPRLSLGTPQRERNPDRHQPRDQPQPVISQA
uniref:Uncharacterized protein n=1 Tax=Globodera pallida TaxID=36090 RepID=A0A183BLN3_GLOPA